MLSGNVFIHKRNSSSFKIIENLTCSTHCVNILQLSANQIFLAASDDGGNVFVWNFKTFETVFHWSENNSTKALIAWHPWKESYLIICKLFRQKLCCKSRRKFAYFFKKRIFKILTSVACNITRSYGHLVALLLRPVTFLLQCTLRQWNFP